MAKNVLNWTNLEGRKISVWGNKVKCNDGKKRMLFSTTTGRKKSDGTYENMFYDVKFIDDAPTTEGQTEIIVDKGFISFSTFSGSNKPCLIIQEYSEM